MGTNTGLGIGIGIPFKNNALGGDKPYFPPELKARMIGVWTNYGKKNTDADRNIIKNKIPNAGGDLEILNAAYKLNSGFGEYNEDFTTWIKSSKITSINSESFDFITNVNWVLLSYKSDIGKDISSFKVRIKLKGKGKVYYNYITLEGVYTTEVITSEEYVTPISYNTKYTGETPVNCGFTIGIISDECSGTITQIPNFEDAFVSDGINDMIVSQKTLQEMGVTKGLTIVSMIHQISFRNSTSVPLTNYIRNGDTFIRNSISNIGKTGIYGYTCFDIKNVNYNASKVINNILGDKNDYIVEYKGDILSERFSVQGYIDANGNILETSSVAHYWTFAVLGKATEDEINLIIANYNLDRSLKPDILCNIGKQGITNDNHADFNDKLVDYSGNSRDIQTYNLAWKGGSGIAAKPFETIKDYTIISDETRQKLTIYNEFSYKVKSNTPNHYWAVQSIIKDNTSYQVTIITDKDCYWINSTSFINNEGNKESIRKEYPVKANTPTQVTICGLNEFEYSEDIEPTTAVSYVNLNYAGEVTVTFIPSCKGGLLLDGINDFGKVTGMPVYKDYTFIIDRKFLNETFANQACLASKSKVAVEGENGGAFIIDNISINAIINPYSFYKTTSLPNLNTFDKQIVFQSKYKYLDKDIAVGTAIDSDILWLGTFRDNDNRFANVAIYSLMSFPYSMSEFLIERQLKKHKLGTLYPNMVEFRPVIKANANYKITYYQIDSTNTWKSIKVGDYIVIGAKLAFQITFDNDTSELKEVVSPQLSGIIVEKRPSNPGYNIYSYITSKSPQKINITIDEYIRYEDIVQPYPSIINLVSIDKTHSYIYGDKLKVGDVILYNSYKNLLKGLYSLNGQLKYNGVYIYDIDGRITVAKEMVFSWTVSPTWLLDNNEPKCILSPRLLRIPNSSYKILGYIPDISGHGNHGKINNSAYAGASGANGYLLDFKTFTTGNSSLVNIKDDSRIEVININKEKSATWINLNKSTRISLSSWKIKVTGMKSGDTLAYYYSKSTDATLRNRFEIKSDGIYSLPSSIANSNNIGGIAFDVVAVADSAYRIEQIGKYEGAYCLDGVDDFVTIPTVTGGKQVLMKVNWLSDVGAVTLYDQRLNLSDYEFAIYNGTRDLDDNPVMAYQGRNNGQTYIDGILNSNIMASELKAITHNITITNELSLGINNTYPVIGSTRSNTHFAQMSLYDFMLFDEISTDDKIKELNEYVGIEAKVELPPYYWDTYGKTNSDADRDTIQQRGVAVGDYDLTNYNHAYEGMSGYNGYPVVFGIGKTYGGMPNIADFAFTTTPITVNVTRFNTTHGLIYSYLKRNGVLENQNTDYPSYNIRVTGIEEGFDLRYYYLESPSDVSVNEFVMDADGTYTIPKSFASDGSLINNDVWIGFIFTGTAPESCNVTIEVLPEYENGLAYDGIEDFSDNKNIPIFTDFTAIIKRIDLDAKNNNSSVMFKGNKIYKSSIGNGFILDYHYDSKNYVYSYGKVNRIERDDSKIIYLTPESYNGNPIIKGENGDNLGLILGKYWKGIIYKTILYSKTISLLEINFLKNLMEKDEIIDLTNPIFIKDE